MSNNTRMNWMQAFNIAANVKNALEDLCDQVVIAGSIRRMKDTVGDIEVVVLPRQLSGFLARLDRWVFDGKAQKAIYSDGRTRWGNKLRGLQVDGARVEIFVADPHNYGWILALRTGAADANTYVMTQCARHNSPYRSKEGYWWVGDRRISVPNEAELFRLWGLKTIVNPEHRTVETYQRLLAQPKWVDDWTYVEEEPETGSEQLRLL